VRSKLAGMVKASRGVSADTPIPGWPRSGQSGAHKLRLLGLLSPDFASGNPGMGGSPTARQFRRLGVPKQRQHQPDRLAAFAFEVRIAFDGEARLLVGRAKHAGMRF